MVNERVLGRHPSGLLFGHFFYSFSGNFIVTLEDGIKALIADNIADDISADKSVEQRR